MAGEKKKLVVNCATCDISGVQQSTLDAYESIRINAANVISSTAARARLAGYDMTVSAASTLDVPDGADVRVSTANGTMSIRGGQKPAHLTLLTVNGSLTLEKDAADSLAGYIGITVNGTVRYPASLAAALPAMNVNGTSETYPDDAVLLSRTFEVDRTFALRAGAARYYAASRVVLLAPEIDVAAIRAAGATFLTKRAVLAERYVKEAAPLFPPETELIIVPDGTAFVRDDLTLEESTLKRYGDRLYIAGNLTLNEKSASALAKLRYVNATGDVRLPASMEDAFLALDAVYQKLEIVYGKAITDKISLTIDTGMLEAAPDGLQASDCVTVRIGPDVPPALIRQRLRLSDCAVVTCTSAQRSAVEEIAVDCAQITQKEKGGFLSFIKDDEVKGILHPASDAPDTKVVNAVFYKL